MRYRIEVLGPLVSGSASFDAAESERRKLIDILNLASWPKGVFCDIYREGPPDEPLDLPVVGRGDQKPVDEV